MNNLSFSEKVIAIAKLEKRARKIRRKIKKIEKKNRKMVNDYLIVRPDQHKLFSESKALHYELAATALAQATIMGLDI